MKNPLSLILLGFFVTFGLSCSGNKEAHENQTGINPSEENQQVKTYLSQNLEYIPYINLAFALPELLELTEEDNRFQQAIKEKIGNFDKELPFWDEFKIINSQLLFFKQTLLNTQKGNGLKDSLLAWLPEVAPDTLEPGDYIAIMEKYGRADGGRQKEIANSIFTSVILFGDTILSAKDATPEAELGYNSWINNLENTCFVAMADDKVPAPIIERKRAYLLSSVSPQKHPALHAKLENASISVID